MADNDDWRARRAAELIGTPFERPTTPTTRFGRVPGEGDQTLPMTRPVASAAPVAERAITAAPVIVATKVGQPAAVPPSAKPAVLPRAAAWSAGLIAAAGVAIGLMFADRRTPPATAVSPAQITLTMRDAPIRGPAAPPMPRIATTSPPLAVPAAIVPVQLEPSRNDRISVRHTAGKTTPTTSGTPKQKIRTVHKSARRRADTPTRAPVAVTAAPAVTAATVTANTPVLPVCQPGVYNRAPRPCRPSHDRITRKPFFDR